MTDYRQDLFDIYERHAMSEGAASESVLESRRPYFDHIIQRHFPADKRSRIWDLGCGYGALLHRLKNRGYSDLSGIDASPKMVQEAVRLGLSVKEGQLLEALHVKESGSVDVLCMMDVLEHLRKEEAIAVGHEVARVLAPGGRWIVHVPNGDAPFFGRVFYGDLTHETAFTRSSLAQLSELLGFSSIECFEDKPVVHGAKSAVRSILWKGIRGALRVYLAAETGSGRSDVILSQNLLAVFFK